MKQNKGAISLYTLLSMLFFLIFIMVAYSTVSSSSRLQTKTTEIVTDEYKPSVEPGTIFTTMYDTNQTINVNTVPNTTLTNHQTNTIQNNKGSYIFYNNKIYLIN